MATASVVVAQSGRLSLSVDKMTPPRHSPAASRPAGNHYGERDVHHRLDLLANLDAFHQAFKEDGHENRFQDQGQRGRDIDMRRVVEPGDGERRSRPAEKIELAKMRMLVTIQRCATISDLQHQHQRRHQCDDSCRRIADRRNGHHSAIKKETSKSSASALKTKRHRQQLRYPEQPHLGVDGLEQNNGATDRQQLARQHRRSDCNVAETEPSRAQAESERNS